MSPANGGTGINNSTRTLTIGGLTLPSLSWSGSGFSQTLQLTLSSYWSSSVINVNVTPDTAATFTWA